MLLVGFVLLLGHGPSQSHVSKHSNDFIKSTSRKYSQVEKYHLYDPVAIEHKSIPVSGYNVTYRPDDKTVKFS